jgi:HSP20 family protein
MAQNVPVKTEGAAALEPWAPFETLRREMNRLFEDLDRGFSTQSYRRFGTEPGERRMTWGALPSVDVTEDEKAYEITAELPGMDEKNVEVKLVDGNLLLKGEKKEEHEEKKRDYYLQERSSGSFQRCFRVPEGVDTSKIDAKFKNGVLTMTLPKTAEAQKAEKKIAIRAG